MRRPVSYKETVVGELRESALPGEAHAQVVRSVVSSTTSENAAELPFSCIIYRDPRAQAVFVVAAPARHQLPLRIERISRTKSEGAALFDRSTARNCPRVRIEILPAWSVARKSVA